ncbi:hypothetical protein C2857_002945 [Epichloe festucae Fl1]|uniref:G-patch domain-containing protein n=1 Tax=Epichloe festucae (strain Fl1) TaxID=877507 RepID=A0A7U3Q1V2_EPIFF|nr:hypothetical protein C2857_002945 [Epichloe festucae Fl1]
MRRLRNKSNDDDDDDDDDNIPLHHKKPFGAGLKRKRVEFVRATETDNGIAASTQASPNSAVGDLYASIVLGGDERPKSASAPATRLGTPRAESSTMDAKTSICAVCSLSITTSAKEHEASVAHQVNMPHAHPPSALDRSRMGLRALESLGWDPDARRGLGRQGEGVRYPIKVKAKDDTLGIGATVAEKVKQEEPPRKLTGKELKAAMARDKQRAERLQAEIYGRVDVESYIRRQMDE